MIPHIDPFAQVLCDLASSVEISKQLESELEQVRQITMRGSGRAIPSNHCDFHLFGARSEAATL